MKFKANLTSFFRYNRILNLFSSQDRQSLFFVMEYVPHGPLSSLIIKRKGLPLELTRLYAAQLVLFLEYLHT